MVRFPHNSLRDEMHLNHRGGLDFPNPSMACYDRPLHGGYCIETDQYMSMDGGMGQAQMNLNTPRRDDDMDTDMDGNCHQQQQQQQHFVGQPNEFGAIPFRKSVGGPTSCMPTQPTAANSPAPAPLGKAHSTYSSGSDSLNAYESADGSSDYDSCLGPEEVPPSLWAQATRGVLGTVLTVRQNRPNAPIPAAENLNAQNHLPNMNMNMNMNAPLQRPPTNEMPQAHAVKRAGNEMYGIGEYTAKRQRFAPGYGPTAQQGLFMFR